MERRRVVLVLLAVAAAGASGAVVWRALDAAAPRASGPDLAMPAPPTLSEDSEPSSLGMVRRPEDEEPAKKAPKPSAKPQPAPPPEPELEAVAKAPPQPPPAPKKAGAAPPRLRSMLNWTYALPDDVDRNGNPVVHYLQPAQQPPPQQAPQAAQTKQPPPPAQKDETAIPPPPPPARRGYRPAPPPVSPVETGPTTQVSAAPPPRQEEAADPQAPLTTPQPEITNVTFVTRGGSDTPPPPNPVAPNATASACLKAGAWKNTWTGVCYATRDLCQQAQPNGQCVQPPGPGRKARVE